MDKNYPSSKLNAAGTGRFGTVVQSAISAPSSGPTGTGRGIFAFPAAILYCTTSKALFVNEGTLASPYWTPMDIAGQRGLIGTQSDWGGNAYIKQLPNSDTTLLNDLGDGVKVAGVGIAETDSGLVITIDEAGRIARMESSATDAKMISLNPTGVLPIFQPDTHGPFVVDAEFANVSALTARSLFIGFTGSNINANTPMATAVTATVTFTTTMGDDVAGILMDSRLTLATSLMCIHDKDNANGTQLVTAAGVYSGRVMPAAATYGRFRVECDQFGTVRYFFNKTQIGISAGGPAASGQGLEVTEEVSPVLAVMSTASTVAKIDVKSFGYWGVRA